MFGQDLFAVNNYSTGTVYTFRFDNNYKVEVTKSKRDYYTMSVFDREKKICHASSWLDTETLTKYLNNIKNLGDF